MEIPETNGAYDGAGPGPYGTPGPYGVQETGGTSDPYGVQKAGGTSDPYGVQETGGTPGPYGAPDPYGVQEAGGAQGAYGTPGPGAVRGAHPADADWPGNELEEVLVASLGSPAAGPRIVEVLARSSLWVPLPNGGGPDSGPLDLPTTELDGQAYVPVFSSEQQFRRVAGPRMPFAVAPAVQFARGLPPQLGIVVNPEGAVGVPLPPPAVAELCRAGRTPLDGPATGGRVRLFEPDWQDEPVDFLAAAAGEFQQSGTVVTARRTLASVEGGDPELFVGVQLSSWEAADRNAPMDALGRALGRESVQWPVHLLLLDMAQDPVADWMLERVRPFYQREN